MRVISGLARGTKLVTPEGMNTRPTTDRIKETLFNILFSKVYDSQVLDLFSGSGAIGIEALSRGAKSCIFIEKDKKALTCIKNNLKKTRLEDKSMIIPLDVIEALQRMKDSFDIIHMDPPYELNREFEVLSAIIKKNLLKEDGIIIIEAKSKKIIDDLEKLSLQVVKEKEYGSSKHIFLQKIGL